MIDTISSASAASSAAASVAKTAEATGAGSQDYFLKLLVAQMKNQDPLNPLDNAQVTTQLAQINTVQGIDKLATKLDALLAGATANQPLAAASLVGHTVMAPGTTLTLQDGQALGGIELAGAVDHLVVTIKDASGQTVHSVDLGAHQAGVASFGWDGMTDAGAQAKSGAYTFSAEAKSGTAKVVANTLSAALVSGVTPSADGASLTLAGLGQFGLSQIKQIF